MRLKMIETKPMFQTFWSMYFEPYMIELSKTCAIDLEYFTSSEYQDAVEACAVRDSNPIRTILFEDQDIKGFTIYQELETTAYILEFCILKDYRNQGLGAKWLNLVEDKILEAGYLVIELTPTNAANERFWHAHGYNKTSEVDEDGKFIYIKTM